MKEEKNAKVFGTPSKTSFQKWNTPLASNSETLPERAACGRGSTFGMESASQTPSRCPTEPVAFFSSFISSPKAGIKGFLSKTSAHNKHFYLQNRIF
jgi:hypothetical protein